MTTSERPTSEAWKLVPVEPDDAMIETGQDALEEKNSWGGRAYASDVWKAMLASAPASPAIGVQAVTDEMVEHMVNRFLQWKLPEHFYPDCGITFDASYRSIHGPVGTNLFTAEQAKAMVRHMLEGLPSASVSADEINVILSEHTNIENGPFVAVQIASALEAALHLAPEAASAGGALPADVMRLVIAARNVAYADDPHVETLNELDQAAEAFASRVPWDDEPDLGADGVSPDTLSDTAPSPKGVSDGVRDVLAERRRQIEAEGWTPEHDDEHTRGEIAAAAVCYAFTAVKSPHHINNLIWPWPSYWWKPTDKRRNLVKAGALILAEIERLDRSALSQEHAPGRKESQ